MAEMNSSSPGPLSGVAAATGLQPPRRGSPGSRYAEARFDVTAAVLLTATSVVLGVQLIRVLFPAIGWYLRDTVGVATFGLIPYAVAPFAAAFLAPVVTRVLRGRAAVVTVAVALSAARLLEQVSSSPAVDLWVSMSGVVFFLWLLPVLTALTRGGFAAGFLLGLAADTALTGLSSTLDLSWVQAWWATGLVAAVVVAHLVALRVVARDVVAAAAPRGRAALALVAAGPILFVELLFLANQGWVTEVTGWRWSGALAWILTGLLGGIVAAGLPRVVAAPLRRWLGLLGGGLAVPVVFVATGPVTAFAVAGVIAHAGIGLLLASAASSPRPVITGPETDLVRQRGAGATRPRIGAAAAALGVGHLVFVTASLLYYITYDLDVPLDQRAVIPAAAALIALAGIAAGLTPREPGPAWTTAPVVLATVFLLVPALLLTTGHDPAPPEPERATAGDYPLTVMTYNVHSGYGTDGTQDLEAIAAVIEASGAHVVGFQEISRGWLLNGSTDMVGWLQRRLAMPYVAFHATTHDPVWGNAVMSRHPIAATEEGLLPELDSLIRRGYLTATIDMAGGPLSLTSTHLHHTGDLDRIHAAQVEALLEAWDGRPHSLLVGDFNARPGWDQVEQVLTAGFEDAWQVGSGPGYTANATDPRHRIDWIFHTPDLTVRSVSVVESQASDHFPVVARIEPAGAG